MKKWIRNTISVSALVAGAIAFTGGTAQADIISHGNSGLLVGNQIGVPINVAVNATGNGVGVFGAGIGSSSDTGAVAIQQFLPGNVISDGNSGLGVGNQLGVPINTAVNICGNGVGGAGLGIGSCVGGWAVADQG